MTITYLDKAPADLVDVSFDFSDWVAGTSIASISWSVPAGLVEQSQVTVGAASTVWLGGGTAGSDYAVTVIAVGADGRTTARTVVVRVRAWVSITTVSTDPFEVLVAPDVPRAPLDLIRQKIVEAAHEFCRDSLAWVERLPAAVSVKDQQTYALAIPAQTDLLSVTRCKYGTSTLKPAMLPDVRNSDSTGTPAYYSHDDALLWLAPIPNAAGVSILADVALAPSLDATSLPAFLAQRHRNTIAQGAKAKLMLGVSDWANPQLAVANQALFDDAVSTARRSALIGRADGNARINPRRFGS